VGDAETAASYRKVADDWAATVDRWTATTTAPDGVGHHYLRITESGKTLTRAQRLRSIAAVELLISVRLSIVDSWNWSGWGIKNADDPLILSPSTWWINLSR